MLAGRLVEERICDGATPITLGQSIQCTLSVPVDGVPREHVLFARQGERFVLRPVGGPEVVLEPGARGKLRIGEAVILYQELARPPTAPPARLPRSVRGTLGDRIDRRLAVIVGASLLLHAGIALFAWQGDVDTGSLGMPHLPEQFSTETVELVPDVMAPVTTAPAAAVPASPVQAPHRIVRPAPVVAPTRDDAASLAAILTSSREGEVGPAGMSRRQPGADLDEQMRAVRNRRITIGDGGHVSRVDDRARIGTVPDSIPIEDPTLTRVPHHETGEPTGRIAVVQRAQPGDDPSPDLVLAKIRDVYGAGLRRCYSRALAADPGLSGKLQIGFTVNETGRVTAESATGSSQRDLEDCITGQMKLWRFTAPKDGDGDPTDATYHIGLVLQPT